MREKLNLKPKDKKQRIKWKNRTEEDKQRIVKKRNDDIIMKGKVKEGIEIVMSGRRKQSMKKYNDLLLAHEIPLLCYQHGWVSSKHYTIIGNLVIEGYCPECRSKISRVINILSEGVTIGVTIAYLIQMNRLTDKREMSQ